MIGRKSLLSINRQGLRIEFYDTGGKIVNWLFNGKGTECNTARNDSF